MSNLLIQRNRSQTGLSSSNNSLRSACSNIVNTTETCNPERTASGNIFRDVASDNIFRDVAGEINSLLSRTRIIGRLKRFKYGEVKALHASLALAAARADKEIDLCNRGEDRKIRHEMKELRDRLPIGCCYPVPGGSSPRDSFGTQRSASSLSPVAGLSYLYDIDATTESDVTVTNRGRRAPRVRDDSDFDPEVYATLYEKIVGDYESFEDFRRQLGCGHLGHHVHSISFNKQARKLLGLLADRLKKCAESLTNKKGSETKVAQALEKHIDPSDGIAYTLDEMRTYYSKTFGTSHIETTSYWLNCKAASGTAASANGHGRDTGAVTARTFPVLKQRPSGSPNLGSPLTGSPRAVSTQWAVSEGRLSSMSNSGTGSPRRARDSLGSISSSSAGASLARPRDKASSMASSLATSSSDLFDSLDEDGESKWQHAWKCTAYKDQCNYKNDKGIFTLQEKSDEGNQDRCAADLEAAINNNAKVVQVIKAEPGFTNDSQRSVQVEYESGERKWLLLEDEVIQELLKDHQDVKCELKPTSEQHAEQANITQNTKNEDPHYRDNPQGC